MGSIFELSFIAIVTIITRKNPVHIPWNVILLTGFSQERRCAHSVNCLNFVISSRSSCRSISLILVTIEGMSVLASSAVSQHRVPDWEKLD